MTGLVLATLVSSWSPSQLTVDTHIGGLDLYPAIGYIINFESNSEEELNIPATAQVEMSPPLPLSASALSIPSLAEVPLLNSPILNPTEVPPPQLPVRVSMLKVGKPWVVKTYFGGAYYHFHRAFALWRIYLFVAYLSFVANLPLFHGVFTFHSKLILLRAYAIPTLHCPMNGRKRKEPKCLLHIVAFLLPLFSSPSIYCRIWKSLHTHSRICKNSYFAF